MELAAHFGAYDWRRMLASAPAGTLLEWKALQARQPFTSFEQASYASTSIVNEIRKIAAGLGGDKDPKWMMPDALVPGREEAREEAEERLITETIDGMHVF